jgi:ribonucleoside-diphosphate reductase beta chain
MSLGGLLDTLEASPAGSFINDPRRQGGIFMIHQAVRNAVMSRYADDSREMRLDPDSFAGGYFRHAVYNHWDPYEDIPDEKLETDLERLVADEPTAEEFDEFRQLLAQFGAGEEAVTEDLAPMSIVLDDINDQMFIASQIYEEAKHAVFFDRYWRDVVNPAAAELGFEVHPPTAGHYFNDSYVHVFDETDRNMESLLEDDSPEQMAKAIAHYHVVVESVMAQTGYYSFQEIYGAGDSDITDREMPHLPGVLEGVGYIRSDEGRHVGWGVRKLREFVQNDVVDPQIIRDTLQDLMVHVAKNNNDYSVISDPGAMISYSRDKLTRRIEIITEHDAEVPDVEELVALENGGGAAAD